MRFRPKIRIFLLMLALGLATVRFFGYVFERWTEVQVDVPQVRSETPIIVATKPTLTKQFLYKQSFIREDRDLSQFDNGGTFNNHCWSKVVEKSCKQERNKVRQFLFNRWKEKKRATISYYWSGADVEGKSYFFIEPDDNGIWRIIIVQEYFGFQYLGDNLNLFEATSIKYKRANRDDYPFNVGTYYLSFTNKNGEEVKGL